MLIIYWKRYSYCDEGIFDRVTARCFVGGWMNWNVDSDVDSDVNSGADSEHVARRTANSGSGTEFWGKGSSMREFHKCPRVRVINRGGKGNFSKKNCRT